MCPSLLIRVMDAMVIGQYSINTLVIDGGVPNYLGLAMEAVE